MAADQAPTASGNRFWSPTPFGPAQCILRQVMKHALATNNSTLATFYYAKMSPGSNYHARAPTRAYQTALISRSFQ
jgi:hypothetical protein